MIQDTSRTYFLVCAVIFGLVSIIHLVRALNDWAFIVGPITIPLAASWLGFVITGALCIWAIRLTSSR